jgi:hypothetical protein
MVIFMVIGPSVYPINIDLFDPVEKAVAAQAS